MRANYFINFCSAKLQIKTFGDLTGFVKLQNPFLIYNSAFLVFELLPRMSISAYVSAFASLTSKVLALRNLGRLNVLISLHMLCMTSILCRFNLDTCGISTFVKFHIYITVSPASNFCLNFCCRNTYRTVCNTMQTFTYFINSKKLLKFTGAVLKQETFHLALFK